MRFAIGFTGTRAGLCDEQWPALARILREVAPPVCRGAGLIEAYYGDCVGADAEFHRLVRSQLPGAWIVVHPGPADDVARQAGCVGDDRWDPRPHMVRNRHIVLASDVVLAAPREETQQPRGGTWRTVEMARRAGKPLALVLPSGVVQKERWV